MPCMIGNGVIVCTATIKRYGRAYQYCPRPMCKQRRRVLIRFYEWYDPDWTCLACGAFNNGERWIAPSSDEKLRWPEESKRLRDLWRKAEKAWP